MKKNAQIYIKYKWMDTRKRQSMTNFEHESTRKTLDKRTHLHLAYDHASPLRLAITYFGEQSWLANQRDAYLPSIIALWMNNILYLIKCFIPNWKKYSETNPSYICVTIIKIVKFSDFVIILSNMWHIVFTLFMHCTWHFGYEFACKL